MMALGATILACTPSAERRAPRAEQPPSAERRGPSTDPQATRNDSLLVVARAAYEQTPDNADSIIWLGRRTAYLGHYDSAIAIYGGGIALHPDDARLYRHRGHRYISTRRFTGAIADLERAAELIDGHPDQVEPDGLPNARNIPTSTLQSNIWYHLGLARYLTGDFTGAARAYERGLAVSANPDMLTAMSYWLYLARRRQDEASAAGRVLAAVRPDFDIIENHAYHRLMMLYQGRLPVDSLLPPADSLSLEDVTTAYGVGMWHLLAGRHAEARRMFRRITAAESQRAAFGYIAAEAELRR